MVGCSVPNCSKNSSREKGLSFFSVPAILRNQCARTLQLSTERRATWLSRMGLAYNDPEDLAKRRRVCSRHFISGRPSYLFDRLNPDWAPSLNLGDKVKKISVPAVLGRYLRAKNRQEKKKTAAVEVKPITTKRRMEYKSDQPRPASLLKNDYVQVKCEPDVFSEVDGDNFEINFYEGMNCQEEREAAVEDWPVTMEMKSESDQSHLATLVVNNHDYVLVQSEPDISVNRDGGNFEVNVNESRVPELCDTVNCRSVDCQTDSNGCYERDVVDNFCQTDPVDRSEFNELLKKYSDLKERLKDVCGENVALRNEVYNLKDSMKGFILTEEKLKIMIKQ